MTPKTRITSSPPRSASRSPSRANSGCRRGSADAREERRDLGRERLRLLERREVPAAPGLAPVADVGEARGGLGAGRALELVREDRAAGGRIDAVARLERPLEPAGHVAEALPVQPRR